MNEFVAKFIEEQKQKQEENRLKEKENHLLNLGIVDKEKSSKKYCPPDMLESDRKAYGYIYQDDKGYFRYEGTLVVLDISDEDYEEICKVCPPKIYKNKDVETKIESNSFAENFVTVLAWIVLVIGVIGFIAFLAIAADDYDFNWSLFGTGIGLLLSCTISWGVLLVLSNISRKLDRLN